jgi:hypothetical protein
LPFDDPNSSFGDRLRRETVFFDSLESENVAGEIETGDLSPPFSEHFTSANGTTDYLIDVVGWIVLANDFRIRLVGPHDPDSLNG